MNALTATAINDKCALRLGYAPYKSTIDVDIDIDKAHRRKRNSSLVSLLGLMLRFAHLLQVCHGVGRSVKNVRCWAFLR